MDTGLQIAQIFLVRAHFGHRNDFMSLPPRTSPGHLKISFQAQLIVKDDQKAAALIANVKTDPDDKPLYDLEVEMMAIVSASTEGALLPPAEYAAGAGVSTVFPFLRETVANLTMRGRFGPVWLAPVNVQEIARSLAKSLPKSKAGRTGERVKAKKKTE